ncbi:MAG TPA: PQQ-binding-like beta-propeller repeat protein [Candidatus Bathyarchaeia archaeon]|nr:PQQ-binding-like beta-propeller repeat protein [Candidatus Bathyarchaeia archaeon]
MNSFKQKLTIAITSILALSITLSLFALPLANAQRNPGFIIPTYAYINVAPNPVGVGQKVDILIWVDKPRVQATLGNAYRMHRYNLTILDSSNAVVLSQYWEDIIDPTSSQYYAWTPTAVGNYTLLYNFLGFYAGNYPSAAQESNDTYLPSSARTTLIVQEEQLPSPITSYPLPTEYWTRPIFGENTDWWSISSNWLGTGSPGITGFSLATFSGIRRESTGDAVGSQTSHIMWTKELQWGGVVGGTANTRDDLIGNAWFEGSAYNQRFVNPIIIGGRLFYRPPVSFTGSNSGPLTSVDLRTGKVIWINENIGTVSFGLVYDVEDPQQHGVYPAFLVQVSGSTWRLFDAWTGNSVFNATGVPSNTGMGDIAYNKLGPQGEHLRYVISNAGTTSNPNWTLAQWNSTRLFTGMGFSGPSTQGGLSPTPHTTSTTTWAWQNTTSYINNSRTVTSENVTTTTVAVDASVSKGDYSRYDWNVSINDWRAGFGNTNPFMLAAFYNDMIIFRQGSLPGLTLAGFGPNSQAPYNYFAVNLNPSKGPIGSILWNKTYGPPAGNITVLQGNVNQQSRVFNEAYKETAQFVGYDMDTGERLWTTDPQTVESPLDYYGSPYAPFIATVSSYGNLYTASYGGLLRAYDLRTGAKVWTYGNGGPGNSTSSGRYLAYGHYPMFIAAVGNGVIYTLTTEHTVNTPIYKGALARAVNATDGTEIWTLPDYTGTFSTISYAIADGFNVFFNGYDNRLYSVGRGPSVATVSAPDVATPFGTPVIIKGTVMDISAGTQQDEQAARFPKGVPVMSDASMTEWMGYVYQQRPRPTSATGVDVTLSVLDSNGNSRDIGTVTTDADGFFSYQWTPEISGKYIVTARFAGTQGYWPSQAVSAFGVMEAPAPPAQEPETPPDMTSTYVLYAAIGIIIAIVIVGAIIILVVRKRP